MSQTIVDFQISSKDTERRFSFLKKRMKTPKISRLKLQQNFACKGWNANSTAFGTESGNEAEIMVTSSPSKFHLASSKINENYLKRKPILVEISNIESVFKEDQLKSCSKNTSHNLHDFVQKLYKQELNINCNRKRLFSASCNVQDMKESFQAKKLHYDESLRCDHTVNLISQFGVNRKSCKASVKPIYPNKNKFQEFPNAFAHKKSVSQNTDSDISFIKTIDSPIKEDRKNHKISFQLSNINQRKFLNFSEAFVPEKSLPNTYSDTSVIKNTYSPVKEDKKIHKNLFHISSMNKTKFHNIPEAFVPDKSVSQNTHSDISVIESAFSPVKDKKIHKNLIHLSDINQNKFQNLSEAFGYESTEKSVKNFDELLIKEESSPVNEIKKNGFKRRSPLSDMNKIKIQNLCNVFNFTDDRCMNKNSSTCDFVINNEYSPVLPSCALPVENQDVTMNTTSQEDCRLELKSMVYNNKDFVQILQSNIQKSSTDKGSSWMQSLHWTDLAKSKDVNSESSDQIEMKTLRRILPGGFAEQMLKLQRKEQSDRVIWNHKKNELKKKAGTSYIELTMASVLHHGDIIITKCIPNSSDENIKAVWSNCNVEVQPNVSSCDNVLHDMDLTQFIVLFKKTAFSKLQLRAKDVFIIYPPWQTVSVPSLSCPVILCTYFVDSLQKSPEVAPDVTLAHQPQPDVQFSMQDKQTEHDVSKCSNDPFGSSDMYGKCITISARVQRIWENSVLNERIQDILKIEYYLSYSLLLQTEEGIFLQLRISSDRLSQSLLEFLCKAEGGCYKFNNLKVCHRYNLKKYPQLFKVLDLIQNQCITYASAGSSQMFCYQCVPSSAKMPEEISEENFPVYSSFEIKSLSFFQRSVVIAERFSCLGKVLFQNKNDFYISDESLLGSKQAKYCKLKFLYPHKVLKQPIGGKTVFIKEAVVHKDFLFIDQFSCCKVLSNSSSNKMLLPYQSRLKKITLVTFEQVLLPLSLTSKIQELVLVNGTIIHVDENGAISWLECSICSKENLLEDSNSVIYCEDCSCVVPKPILKVKMEVTIHSSTLPNAGIQIQLLSSTIKRILKISEDDYQPQCNITDVLQRSVETLSCCIRDVKTVNDNQVFYLTEINSF